MSPPLAPQSSPAPGSDTAHLTGRLRKGFEAGRRAYGEFELTFATYAGDVLAAVRARRVALDLPIEQADLANALRKRALEDLYLARACEHGCERAWAVFTERFRSRLLGLAVHRGARGAQAESVGDELLSDLALPPPKASARTRIGTFDGSGSLWGWLAASLVRRLHDAHRRAKPSQPLEASELGAPAARAPVAAMLDDETRASLRATLATTWNALEAPERAALLFKHQHGWTQRQIADRFGVGEHQVSRWCSRAVNKLRGAVQAAASLAGPIDEGTWPHLRRELERHLARADASGRLPTKHPGDGSPA